MAEAVADVGDLSVTAHDADPLRHELTARRLADAFVVASVVATVAYFAVILTSRAPPLTGRPGGDDRARTPGVPRAGRFAR